MKAGLARILSVATLTATFTLGAALVSPRSAFADAADDLTRAAREIEGVSRDAQGVDAAMARAKASQPTLEARLASAELLYRSKDYERAAVIFGELVEEAPGSLTEGDARFLRGETYFAAQEYLSARRDFRAIVENGNESRYARYSGKALARLIDISVRTGDLDKLDELFSRINQLPPAQVDAAIQYARGKALYVRNDYAQADAALAQVTAPYMHQAGYYLGLVAMRQAPTVSGAPAPAVPGATGPGASGPGAAAPRVDYRTAIERFRRVTTMVADTPEHRHVIDLAWMAIGRLQYEAEAFKDAAEAYKKVDRNSKEFETMLYELAWVYVRMGDVQRAERALEVLAIADPESQELGEGSLLRADLLLRAGSFRKAEGLYNSVKEIYEPTHDRVANFLASETDPGAFYDDLTRDEDELAATSDIPAVAVRWAREAEDGQRAFAIMDDVHECRRLIKQSYELAERLEALLGAGNRAKAFPDLLAGEEQVVGLLNRLAKTRATLARALDGEEPKELGGAMGAARDERRRQMALLEKAPTAPAEFAERDYEGQKQWNLISQSVSQRQREVDSLQATVNGLRRYLKEETKKANGVVRSPADLTQLRDQIDEVERDLVARQKDLASLRRSVEYGRSQVGLGDSRYQAEGDARMRFRQAFGEESELAKQGQGGASARDLGARLVPVLVNLNAEEDRLIAVYEKLDQRVSVAAQEIIAKIEAERAKVTGYETQLAGLDGEARVLVGEVARKNFGQVLQKLQTLVVRADIGLTEHAWEVREEEMYRVRLLQTERAHQETALEEELHEVLDEATEPNGIAPTAPPSSPEGASK